MLCVRIVTRPYMGPRLENLAMKRLMLKNLSFMVLAVMVGLLALAYLGLHVLDLWAMWPEVGVLEYSGITFMGLLVGAILWLSSTFFLQSWYEFWTAFYLNKGLQKHPMP